MSTLSLPQIIKGMSYRQWVQVFGSREDPFLRERVSFDPWLGQLDLCDWVENRSEIWVPKARQLGISELGGEKMAKSMIELPRGEYVAISKTSEDAEYFLHTRLIPKLENLPRVEGVTWPTVVKKTVDTVVLSNGSYAKSLPAVSASGAGRTLNGILLDEFGGVDFQPHCKGSQLYKNIKPTIEKSKGWMWVIGTSEPGSFFNAQLWKQWKGEAARKYYFLSWKTDPNRTVKWYEEARQECETDADFRNQYPADMGEFFATREGKVFQNFEHENGSRHVHEFEPNWDLPLITGYDHGYRHYAACLYCLYDARRDIVYVVDEQFWKGKDVPEIARDIKEYEGNLPRFPVTRLADVQIFNKDGRRTVSSFFQEEGITFRPAYKADEAGSRSLLAGRLAKGGIVIHPRCRQTISQMMNYVWKPGSNGEKPVDKDDEAPDILRWVSAHVHRKDEPDQVKSVGHRREYSNNKAARGYAAQKSEILHWQAL